ncbi:MAG: glycosyl transferase family 1, partial [Symploca sp. SIO2E6]|nr:glycosyl transferase family 1 [Symploca sp. SIO2E6]NET61233.1 glycosyl transferase family 1 [Symploca sp. SIO2E6]
MQILFLHSNFPAQFRHLAVALAKDPNNRVVFGTMRREGSLPGVTKALYSPNREATPQTHHYVRPLENA